MSTPTVARKVAQMTESNKSLNELLDDLEEAAINGYKSETGWRNEDGDMSTAAAMQIHYARQAIIEAGDSSE